MRSFMVWCCGLTVGGFGKLCAKVGNLSTQQYNDGFFVDRLGVLCAIFKRFLHSIYAGISGFSPLLIGSFYPLSTPPIRTTTKYSNFIFNY